jgi:hypothetical protein
VRVHLSYVSRTFLVRGCVMRDVEASPNPSTSRRNPPTGGLFCTGKVRENSKT